MVKGRIESNILKFNLLAVKLVRGFFLKDSTF